MNKVINGKKYDTNTAKELLTWSNNISVADFDYFSETLFLKKTGEYFLYGCGHAASKYAQRCPDGWTTGERIIPLTDSEAKKWTEEHFDGDTYESVFGKVKE